MTAPPYARAAYLALAASLALVPRLPAQQRPVADISGSTAPCQDAIISPDGQFVAYRSGNRLAAVRRTGGGEISLHTGTALSSFLWSPSSSTIYAADGNRVLALPRTGGGATTIATLVGRSVWLWDVSSDGATLFGTRYDPARSEYHAFSLATDGTQAPVALFSSLDAISEIRVDPSDQFLLWFEQATAPFSPIVLMRGQVDGNHRAALISAPLGSVATGPDWIDQGDRAIVSALVAGSGLQVMRADRLRDALEPLTWGLGHQRPTRSPDGAWIVMESVDGVGGNGPALLPVEGGGEVLLLTGELYQYAGSPNIDAARDSVVYSARRLSQTETARVFRADLDGEMRVHPRAETGRTLHFELPAAAGQAGAILLGQRAAPVVLSGISFDYVLGPNFAILGMGVASGSGPIATAVPIPAIPALAGLVIDFQGLRWDMASQSGEWTRSGRFAIF